jgi:hypothetical protein
LKPDREVSKNSEQAYVPLSEEFEVTCSAYFMYLTERAVSASIKEVSEGNDRRLEITVDCTN